MESNATAPQKGTPAVAIAGLVIGILAALTSFIPIINNVSFILALVGAVLGVVGVIQTKGGKRGGKGLAITALVVNIVAIVMVLATQALFSAAIDSAMESTKATNVASQSAETASEQKSEAAPAEKSKKKGREYAVTIDSAKVVESKYQKGTKIMVITYSWTNTEEKDSAFISTLSARAFQNGVELKHSLMFDKEGTDATAQVKPGTAVQTQMGFELADSSEVTAEVKPIISLNGDKDILDTKTFSVE
ncbi:DUF5067 domain-containing protein [Berryella wangjianweii]|uniref:DUF5067 domain-containing protein n=1 Tax=Berryella wangjianweii TaxID=2734634 RepID=A0A6M8J8H0_9ACTN|nr:DUF5067 domain-containing protein [Berryella wangjianweii]QKF07669.1 DUF5067 domain-containing protein [Berryella wangjianweii]